MVPSRGVLGGLPRVVANGWGWSHRFNSPRSPLRKGVRFSSRLTWSVSQGPREPPLLQQTIPDHFSSIVSRYGDQPAVICRSPSTPQSGGPAAYHETTYTYETLDLTSNTLAHSLRSLGVKKGDRVAVSLGNGPEFAALTYAIFKLGAILVPLNPAFNSQQVAAALGHLGVELLIIGAVTDLAYKPCRGRSNLGLLRDLVPDLDSGGGGRRRVESPAVPTLKTVVVVDNTASHPQVSFRPGSHRSLTPFDLLLPTAGGTGSGSVTPDAPLSAAETINIQFTSGTTSHPKAAMLAHTAILNNGALIASRMGLSPADRIVCPPPLFHCFGSVLGYLATATTGAALLLPSPAFDPTAAMRMARDHAATGLYGVATMFVAMLEAAASHGDLADHDFTAHLRTGIAAGSSVPEALMRRLFDRLGLRDLVICYGMTETAPVSCMTTPSDPLVKRTSTVGRVMPHTAVKVVDPADRSCVLPVGERGELAASGYLVMQGYWGDEARTKEARVWEPDGDGWGGGGGGSGLYGAEKEEWEEEEERGGNGGGGSSSRHRPGRVWMYSGDEAAMDEDGFVAITGRIKDLIIRGGENIHPLEIENCLFQHPAVAEVSVVGVPDERYGECVGAFVVLHKGVRVVDASVDGGARGEQMGEKVVSKESIQNWVRERLSSHLVPKHVFWVDEYPKTSSGKIQKYKLRDMAKEMVAGEERNGN